MTSVFSRSHHILSFKEDVLNREVSKIKSSDILSKNYCPSCLQFKNIEQKISSIINHSRKEYDLISSCPDCGTTLKRKNKFYDLGGGD